MVIDALYAYRSSIKKLLIISLCTWWGLSSFSCVSAKTESLNLPQEKTIVEDQEGGFSFVFPYRIDDIARIDRILQSESGHVVGYTMNGHDPKTNEAYTLALTRRDNKPEPGISQKIWNTTWYDKPLAGMTNEEYLHIWEKKEPSLFKDNIVKGGLLRLEGAQSARWDTIKPKDVSGPSRSILESELIMANKPRYRYLFVYSYPSEDDNLYEHTFLDKILPSFQSRKIEKLAGPLNLTKGEDHKGKQYLLSDDLQYNLPSEYHVDGEIQQGMEDSCIGRFTNGQDIISIYRSSPVYQSIQKAYPDLSDLQALSDAYKTTLLKSGASLDLCNLYVRSGEIGYIIAGKAGNESAFNEINKHSNQDELDENLFKESSFLSNQTSNQQKLSYFASYITLTDTGRVIVAKLSSSKRLDTTSLESLLGVQVHMHKDFNESITPL